MNAASEEQQIAREKQVPLAPACLVFFVIGALFLSVSMIVAAWMLMGNQGPLAAKAIETSLIPWVEQSSLEPTDRDSVLQELRDLVGDLKNDRLDDRQMVRLKLRIADSPVLQWGVIQQLEARIQSSTLSEQEKENASLELDRLLRCAGEGKLSMEQLEFIVQKVATKERQTGRLTVLEATDESLLREFLRRCKAVSDSTKIPEEAYPKSPSQVFRGLVEEALSGR